MRKKPKSRSGARIGKTEVAVSSTGLKVSLPAEQGAAVGGYIQTLFSPVLETTGLIGDYIKFFRQAAAIRAMKKVRDIASENDIELRVVSPRILVPWVESVSLENPNSELIDWWARLLITSATRSSMRPYLIELMKLIGPQEAAFLDKLWNSVLSKHDYERRRRSIRNEIYHTVFTRLVKILGRGHEDNGGEWRKETEAMIRSSMREVLSSIERSGVYLQVAVLFTVVEKDQENAEFPTANFPAGKQSSSSEVVIESNFPPGQVAIDVIRGLTVVKIETASRLLEGKGARLFNVEIRILQLTDLGAEFMRACRP